ncbi:phage tail protein [Paracoccus methylovorus]|uniref:Phage tail protein n=2 Tax=Paracoccaceae TaxID=31989 RepID=A0ABX7JKU9_9RHOB|nr:phage tail protein [Paracoccus methylovorus]
MILGPYPFMLHTAAPQAVARRSEYRWEQQDRIGRKPARQFLGAGSDEITMSGEILPHFAGGYRQLDAMRLLAGRGRPLLLVSGRGDVLGDWVITGIEDEGSEFFADGAPGVIAFTMTIAEYGGDRGGISALMSAISAIQTIARLL